MKPDLWAEYLDKMRQLEMAVRLTAFYTRETARACKLTAYHTHEVANNVKEFLNKQK